MTNSIRRSAQGFVVLRLKGYASLRTESDGERFVFRTEHRKILPRVAGDRRIDDISLTEIQEGIRLVLEGFTGNLDREGIISEVSAAFEFRRRGQTITQRIGAVLDDMVSRGIVTAVEGWYVLIG